jgi:two-component system, NtrC family, nitrogen regulation response regulator NtrX
VTPRRTVLVVDDEAGIRRSLTGILADEGYRVIDAGSGEGGLKTLSREEVHLVLLDIWMEGMDGIETLKAIKKDHPDVPVVMMSGHGTIETAVSAIKLGAYDYLEKPLSLDRVTLTCAHALNEFSLHRENRRLKAQVSRRFEMVGESAPVARLKSEIVRVAGACARALITGENGSGKELVAHALHAASPRRERPFIEINCAALPEQLIESELFGYEKGAFTGAVRPKPGMFELADTGTLFLDEVGDMSLSTQARVLRVLQEGRFLRLGGTEPKAVDVWVIAATNRDLKAEVAAGRFREDLYYRLAVVPIEVPPLRERAEDIPALVAHFAGQAALEQGLPPKTFSPEAAAALERAPWRGNVRELKNTVERLIIMSPGAEIGAADLPDELAETPPGAAPPEYEGMGLREARDAFEAIHIRRVLTACGGNISKSAERLHVERSNLSKKIRQLGIDPQAP